MSENDRSDPSTPVPMPAQQRRAHFIRLGAIGLAGAVTVTLLNETVRRALPHAPRIEVIGERALAGSLDALGVDPPHGAALYRWTLLGDLVSNTVYFGLVGLGARQGTWERGGALGLAAGVGASGPTPASGTGPSTRITFSHDAAADGRLVPGWRSSGRRSLATLASGWK